MSAPGSRDAESEMTTFMSVLFGRWQMHFFLAGSFGVASCGPAGTGSNVGDSGSGSRRGGPTESHLDGSSSVTRNAGFYAAIDGAARTDAKIKKNTSGNSADGDMANVMLTEESLHFA